MFQSYSPQDIHVCPPQSRQYCRSSGSCSIYTGIDTSYYVPLNKNILSTEHDQNISDTPPFLKQFALCYGPSLG